MAARNPDNIKSKILPAQAVKILSKNGLKFNEKEVEKILELLYFLGKLAVDQYIKDNSNDIDT
jgi:S-adenosylmethionine:tRNA-ribosyltransferase-isomerase (queuine synthetase)